MVWQQALTDEGTFLRRAVLVNVLVHLAISVGGMIANPDFAAGSEATAVQFLWIDFNGWHALAGILLWAPGLVAVRRTDWTLWYTVSVIVVALAPVAWLLIDNRPLGLLFFPNTASDVVYHVVGAAILGAVVAAHLVLVRRKSAVAA